MPARTLLAALLFTVLLPASAAAHMRAGHGARRVTASRTAPERTSRAAGVSRPGVSSPIVRALDVAERYWHAVPCAGAVTVSADAQMPPALSKETDAWVTFESSLGADNLLAPPTTYTHCVVALAHWQWPTAASMGEDWGMFCLTVIHEVGHLLGHAHSLAPGSVMAPLFSDESDVPQICRTAAPHAANRAG